MPELPEVETVRRGLEEHVVGCRVLDLAIIGPRTVRRHDPNLIKLEVVGKKITGCSRYGKYLILGLDDNLCMIIHLRMTGRLQLITGVPDLHDRHMHAHFTLDNDTSLVFFDPRTFGEIFLSKLMTANNLPEEISSLGPDPIVSDSWKDYLTKTIPTKSIPIKTLLLDQRIISGIGNIYSDEICHDAGIIPIKRSNTLSESEIKLLTKSITAILIKAINNKGSTLGDKKYLDITGGEGSYQNHHKVYKRAGQACYRCKSTIVKVKVSGRSSHYCPNCQF